MRLLIATLGLAFGLPSLAMAKAPYPCIATGDQTKLAFSNYRSNDVEVVVHRGTGHGKGVPAGYSVVDNPATVTCHSSNGCMLRVESMLFAGGVFVCSTVDGKFLRPPQSMNNGSSNYPLITLQSGTVGPGRHVVQTQLYSQNFRTVLYQWEIDYTLYDGG